MKLSVSNLAWPLKDEDAVFSYLRDTGVKGVEIAPFKVWGNLADITQENIASFKDKLGRYGLEATALQGIFGPKTDFRLFEDASRPGLFAYMQSINEIASSLGARVIVFGAPGVRDTMGRPLGECRSIAVEFFGELGKHAEAKGVNLCIEPNAREYNCNFITNIAQGASLVREVGCDGFGLHLDAACMTLEGDTGDMIGESMDILRHFHISEPHLSTFKNPMSAHASYASALKQHSYDKWVSIEMLETPGALESVREAVKFSLATYIH